MYRVLLMDPIVRDCWCLRIHIRVLAHVSHALDTGHVEERHTCMLVLFAYEKKREREEENVRKANCAIASSSGAYEEPVFLYTISTSSFLARRRNTVTKGKSSLSRRERCARGEKISRPLFILIETVDFCADQKSDSPESETRTRGKFQKMC